MDTIKNETSKCSLTSCHYNINGCCQDIVLLKNPWKETGCIYYQNKNIQIKKVGQTN